MSGGLRNDTGKSRKGAASRRKSGRPKCKTGTARGNIRDRKPVGSYRHEGSSRSNLPTDQTGRTMKPDDVRPVRYKVPARKRGSMPPDLTPPHLDWVRDPPGSTQASPLYIHEKLHPSAFAESLKRDYNHTIESFFGSYDGLPKGAEFQWYRHRGHWQNRIIRGESRHVMASLIVKERMAGSVQMIYFDPPYGIDFRSILQANVNKDKDAGDMPNDPVAIQTFRDTYRNGIHSYLDNIHQIASHARVLLNDTGSLFLQIGSANVNRVAVVLDEVFGVENRMGMIPFAKTSGSSSGGLSDVTDYLLWYAKDIQRTKYHQLYEPTSTKKDILELFSSHAMIELKDGTIRKVTNEERGDPDTKMPKGAKLFKDSSLFSRGWSSTRSYDYEWGGRTYKCPRDSQWRVSREGLDRMAKDNRLFGVTTLRWKIYDDEVPGRRINNIWHKQASSKDRHYVVETAESTIERCILMATDPGDLVYDPTCGSGTTAYVAEKWGRRWITSDAGLVAVNLARQRIVTSIFDWHMLKDSEAGHRRENELREMAHQPPMPAKNTYGEDPSKGFVCERLPHTSAKFLAYPDREAQIDYMADRPEKERGRIRVSSPFTVESLSPYRYVNPDQPSVPGPSATSQSIVSALRDTGIRIGGSNVRLADIEEYPGRMITHTATFDGKKACVVVANDDCTVPPAMVDHAVEEAATMPSVQSLIIVAFAYEPAVRNEQRGRLNIYKTMANQDLRMGNLRDGRDDVAFVLVGEPDVKIDGTGDGRMTAEVIGYDTYDPASGNSRPGTGHDVYCWMMDTDYDGRSFFARRIHFPGADNDRQIDRFYKKLQRRIGQDLWNSTISLKSAPFEHPKSERVAVKIITSTHSEMTAVIDVKNKRKKPSDNPGSKHESEKPEVYTESGILDGNYEGPKATPETRRLYFELKKTVLDEFDSIGQTQTKFYRIFFSTISDKPIFYIEFQKSGLKLTYAMKQGTMSENDFCRNVSNIGHRAPGSYQSLIQNSSDILAALYYIRKYIDEKHKK